MRISGAVIILSASPESARAAIGHLRAHPAIEVGARTGGRVPVVLEAGGRGDFDALWRWVRDLEGVEAADLVYVHFDEEHREPCSSSADAS
jgi:nitrate reductase NapAB chaperone NapD